jgi:hypothetical protein
MPAPTETAPAPEPSPEPTITATAPESAAPAATPELAPAAKPAPSQTELLAKAWQSLGTAPGTSLELVDQDQRLHPNGALAEERDALRIQAFAALNRTAEARKLAAQFLASYPQSVHRKKIQAVLQ